MSEDSDLMRCRNIASSILAGQMTPRTHRAAFDEDTVYFAIRTLEKHDREWLLAEVRDRRHSLAGRRNLVMWGLVEHKAEIWAELRAEDPSLPPYPYSR